MMGTDCISPVENRNEFFVTSTHRVILVLLVLLNHPALGSPSGDKPTGSLSGSSGEINWKLSGYRSKIEDAFLRNNTALTVEGPSFYTSGIGYKFGINYEFDGKAIRIGVYPLKGRHDASLKWPFAGRITIALLDQNEPSTSTYRRVLSTYDKGVIASCCPNAWGRNFSDGPQDSCSFGLVFEEELQRRGLIKDDSVIISVEVVAM